ncbi:MAG: hypothetical protein R3F37_13020 [Candidatus Competibacteraceae bacterium]
MGIQVLDVRIKRIDLRKMSALGIPRYGQNGVARDFRSRGAEAAERTVPTGNAPAF